MTCILSSCSAQLSACFADPTCQPAQQCTQACQSTDRVCLNDCFFYNNSTGNGALATCAVESNCVPVPPSNATCPDMANRPLDAGWNITSVLGGGDAATWYVAAGSNNDYDCLACQRIQYTAASVDSVGATWQGRVDAPPPTPTLPPVIRGTNYTLTEVAPGEAHTAYTLKCAAQRRRGGEGWRRGGWGARGSAAGGGGGVAAVRATAHYAAVPTPPWRSSYPIEERYYILDAAPASQSSPAFLFFFYCGFMPGIQYQGALVYASQPNAVVPPEIAAQFDDAVVAAGLQEYVQPLAEFCAPGFPADCPQ